MLNYFNTFLILSVACSSVHGAEPVVPVVQATEKMKQEEDLRVTKPILRSLLFSEFALEALKRGEKVAVSDAESINRLLMVNGIIIAQRIDTMPQGPAIRVVVAGRFPELWQEANRIFEPEGKQKDSFTQCEIIDNGAVGVVRRCTLTMPMERFFKQISQLKKEAIDDVKKYEARELTTSL